MICHSSLSPSLQKKKKKKGLDGIGRKNAGAQGKPLHSKDRILYRVDTRAESQAMHRCPHAPAGEFTGVANELY